MGVMSTTTVSPTWVRWDGTAPIPTVPTLLIDPARGATPLLAVRRAVDISGPEDRRRGIVRTTWRGARTIIAPPAQQYAWRCAAWTTRDRQRTLEAAWALATALAMIGGYDPTQEPF